MIGCSNTGVKGLAPIGAGRISPKLKEVISKVSNEKQYVPVDWLYADTCRFIDSSDHYPFHLKKIRLFSFSAEIILTYILLRMMLRRLTMNSFRNHAD
jgi:hypothetical protein